MDKLAFAVFLTVFLLVFFGMHYFVFTRAADGLGLVGAPRAALRIFFVLAAFAFVLTEFLTRRGVPQWVKPAADFGHIWLGILSMAVAVFVCAEIARFFFRSDGFRYYSAVAAIGLLGITGVYSIYNVARGPIVRDMVIKTRKLPEGAARFVIVQLSDLHIDMLTPAKELGAIVSRTNELDPDVIVITGDLIDADICERQDICAVLKGLKSRFGTYAVSGNHEFYTGMDKFLRTAENAGISIIDGKTADAGGLVRLVGIDDRSSEKKSKAEQEILDAMAGLNGDADKIFSVLLSHRPDTFDAAAKLGIDLQLSGHTHAGQIPPMDLMVLMAYKYPVGLYRKGDSYVYTTTGTGTWGPPMRLFSRSEIVRVILENGAVKE